MEKLRKVVFYISYIKFIFLKNIGGYTKRLDGFNISYFKSLINNLFIIEYWTCKNMYALYRKDKLCL